MIHLCKCHGKPYTVCSDCECEYCSATWSACPRASWHPAHAVGVRTVAVSADLRAQYAEYREALQLLGADHTTVASRTIALRTRDTFETALRKGVFDPLFFPTEHTAEEVK